MNTSLINATRLARNSATISERGMAWLVEVQGNGWAVFESPPLLSYRRICRIEKARNGMVGESGTGAGYE